MQDVAGTCQAALHFRDLTGSVGYKEPKGKSRAAFVLYDHWRVDAHPEPVDGNALISDIIKLLRRYVIFTEDQAIVVALWTVLTYLHEGIATHSPLLLVTSPQPDSWQDDVVEGCRLLGAPWCIKRFDHRPSTVPINRKMVSDYHP